MISPQRRRLAGVLTGVLALGALTGLAPAGGSVAVASQAPPAAAAVVAPYLKVMTYNVKSHGSSLEANRPGWDERRDAVFNRIAAHDPAIFGLQEATNHGADIRPVIDTRTRFPEYASYPDGWVAGQPALTRPIFWKMSRFTWLSSGQRDFNYPNADPSEAAKCHTGNYRMVWTKLQDNHPAVDGGWRWNKYVVVNVHMPNGPCQTSRAAAAREIHREIARINPTNEPVILMGDFNARRPVCQGTAENTIPILMEAANSAHEHNLDVAPGCVKTSNEGWNGSTADDENTVDFVFFSTARFDVSNHVVDRTMNFGGISPSDHYPVVVQLKRK